MSKPVILALLALPSMATAAPVTIQVTAVVSNVVDTTGTGVGAAVPLGTPVAASLTYDSALVDGASGPGVGVYQDAGASVSMSVAVPSVGLSLSTSTSATLFVDLADDGPGGDALSFAVAGFPQGTVAGLLPFQLNTATLVLEDSTAAAWSYDTLPSCALDVAALDTAELVADGQVVGFPGSFVVFATITGMTTAAGQPQVRGVQVGAQGQTSRFDLACVEPGDRPFVVAGTAGSTAIPGCTSPAPLTYLGMLGRGSAAGADGASSLSVRIPRAAYPGSWVTAAVVPSRCSSSDAFGLILP